MWCHHMPLQGGVCNTHPPNVAVTFVNNERTYERRRSFRAGVAQKALEQFHTNHPMFDEHAVMQCDVAYSRYRFDNVCYPLI